MKTTSRYNALSKAKEVLNMEKKLTLDRYEHGLLVRALYEEWHRMLEREEPTEDMEELLLKVINAPSIKKWRIFR
jgi:hypothetical protein